MAVLVVVALVAGAVLLLAGGDDDDDPTETADTEESDGDDSGSESEPRGDGDDPGSDSEPGGDPEDAAAAEAVVEQYFQAVLDQDCEAIFDTVTEATWSDDAGSADEAVSQCEDAVEAGELDIEGEATLDDLEVIDQDEDSVTFEATETISGEELTESFTVVVEDGDWKIDLSDV